MISKKFDTYMSKMLYLLVFVEIVVKVLLEAFPEPFGLDDVDVGQPAHDGGEDLHLVGDGAV